ncbi:hypothetical protein GCM10007304_39210 [Rhodococcoides trifolii]|uniref:Uncharacterized protein n=1 Tax=Rhodococcoides trifolii TaxID=908250 RepID=A0A917LGK6_9NOCA|nr:hypothetical protein [Rhodococcus trifolii]GGG21565.1 hypothetical protein GCM10007304_39210 [Rhodococcus trifolii]
MTWLWIALSLWTAVAILVALVLGRTVARADREELGSFVDWDIAELEKDIHGAH